MSNKFRIRESYRIPISGDIIHYKIWIVERRRFPWRWFQESREIFGIKDEFTDYFDAIKHINLRNGILLYVC